MNFLTILLTAIIVGGSAAAGFMAGREVGILEYLASSYISLLEEEDGEDDEK